MRTVCCKHRKTAALHFHMADLTRNRNLIFVCCQVIMMLRPEDILILVSYEKSMDFPVGKIWDGVEGTMKYQDEWILLETGDEIDEMEHRQLTEEFQFYRAVANGDVEAVKKNCELGRFVESDGVGVLSRNPVTNLKYHFVITTAMITRLCRQNGMELEQAFRLSDFYIQKLDDIHNVEQVWELHDEMVIDFTKKMRRYVQNNTNSRHIYACKEYIYSHIKERITIEDLAEAFGVSASYLSRLFKKETGISISAYIREQKVEIAKNLLRFSDYSMIEIANRLSFSSQSHFIQQFREIVGVTPKKYRDDHYMIQWNIES